MIENNSGKFPIRQDIEVIPADDPKGLRLGWIFYEEPTAIFVDKATWEQLKKEDWKFIWKHRWQRFRFWTKDTWKSFVYRLKGRKPSDCDECKRITHTPGSISVLTCFEKMEEDLIAQDTDIDYIIESRKMKKSGYCPYFQQMSKQELLDLKKAEEYYDEHLRSRSPNGGFYY